MAPPELEKFKRRLTLEGTVDWPAAPPIEFLWRFEMRARRDEVWSYLSDTSRLNREMGFAPREHFEHDGKLLVTTPMLGISQRWIEEPWTWLAGQTIAAKRTYIRGMAKTMHSVFHIENDIERDRRIVYVYFGWQPKNKLWDLFLKVTESYLRGCFTKALAKVDQHFREAQSREGRSRGENAFTVAPHRLEKPTLELIEEIKAELLKRALNPETIERLIQAVSQGDEMELAPIRVVPLSKSWKVSERDLLATCLHATRLGLLNISWDIICPHCRGSRYSAADLGDIPEQAECAVCETSFSTDEANSIEVMFHVQAGIRDVQVPAYCAAEPSKKEHIKIQHALKRGQSLELKIELGEGRYRARCIGQSWQTSIEVSRQTPDGDVEITKGQSLRAGSSSVFKFRNEGAAPALFVLEDLWWESAALKPAQVLSLPDFRDLFAMEHLNSKVKMHLGEQTILFTDIVGSTTFYTQVGDAKAFAEVRSHFQEVFKTVRAHQGVIVKTIGDAVMASFPSPTEAMASAIAIQEGFHAHRRDTSIRLRISVHTGPVIAVHLHAGIDYFGNTVNFTAKIQSCAGAGEIALSESLYRRHVEHGGKFSSYNVLKRKNSRDGAVSVDVYVLQVTAASVVQAA